jgi:hypothetical protein
MMKITSRTRGMINGIKLKVGTHKYDLDPSDPATAMQLEVLRDQVKTIAFGELLPCDSERIAKEKKAKEDDLRRSAKSAKKARKDKRSDEGGGELSGD